MGTMLAILQALAAIAGALGVYFKWKSANEARQDGRNEVAAKENAETEQTQAAIDGVPHPSDDAVADSMRSTKF